MNSFQESKNELEAAIRYAENAISSAQGTIESMEFRQEMAKKQYAEQTGREESLTKLVKELEAMNENLANDNYKLEREVQELYSKVQGQYDDIVVLEREVEVYTKKYNELAQQKDVPTMPVIPKAVAIAIFREGMQHGVESACTELEGKAIEVYETEYCGGFEVTFSKEIDLDDELDLDWMRGKVGDYSEEFVIDALGNLCADKEFECRIHGVDDQETKENAD